jgi:hypothetical protein
MQTPEPGVSLAEQMLASDNCDNNVIIDIHGDQARIQFVIPWAELGPMPLRYEMTLTLPSEGDEFLAVLTGESGNPFDLRWTRVPPQ